MIDLRELCIRRLGLDEDIIDTIFARGIPQESSALLTEFLLLANIFMTMGEMYVEAYHNGHTDLFKAATGISAGNNFTRGQEFAAAAKRILLGDNVEDLTADALAKAALGG